VRLSSLSRWMTAAAVALGAAFSAAFAVPRSAGNGQTGAGAADTQPGGSSPAPASAASRRPADDPTGTGGAGGSTGTGGSTGADPAAGPGQANPPAADGTPSGGGLAVPSQPPVSTRRRGRAVTGAS
jgi:hypothetical protein